MTFLEFAASPWSVPVGFLTLCVGRVLYPLVYDWLNDVLGCCDCHDVEGDEEDGDS